MTSNRVSWAPDSNLSQVKMYQLEDCPSKVGLEAQHHLQLKTSWISQSNGMDFDSCPTGYVNPLRQYVNKEKLSHIPQIRWECPPKFALDYKWRVAAGEESKEAEAQKHREMRVYEAVYPCLSAIPPSPTISLGVEACNYDDSNIPLIPINSIEEETAADLPSDMAAPLNTTVALDLPQVSLTLGYLNTPQCNPPVSLKLPAEKPTLGSQQYSVAAQLNTSVALDLPQGSLTLGYLNTPQCNPPVSLKPPANEKPAWTLECPAVLPLNTSVALDLPQGLLTSGPLNTPQCNPPVFLNLPAIEKPALETSPGMEGDVVVAAAAALAAIIKCKEEGSLIDTDLLIQFLSNPKMIEKLINENEATGYAGSEPVPVPVPKLEKFVNEQGATANTGSEPVSVPKSLSPSISVPSSKPDMLMKKFSNEHGALAKPVTVPVSGPKTVAPLAPLLSLKPEDQIKKLSNEYRSPASIATTLSSWTPSVPFLSSKPDDMVIKNLSNEHQSPASIAATPGSWSPSVPLRSSKPDDMVIKNWSNEHGALAHIGTTHIARSEPVNPLVLLPNSKSEMVMVKRLINEYGAPNAINEPMPRSKLLSTPKPDMVKFPSPSLHPTANVLQSRLHMRSTSPEIIHKPPFSLQTASPVKDINYYKTLIKQHGEGKEPLDHNLSQFGKLHNHIRSPELVQNLKSIESKPKNQKPCMYFKSSKGCRNGSNCPYKHSMSDWLRPGGVMEAPSAKRMKLSGVISGKT